MTTHLLTLTIIIMLNATTSLLAQESSDTCAVTYIANEGVLIKTRDHKVLIDALFGNIKGSWCDQPGDSVSDKIIHGAAPFDGIDVVLVTHKHVDHFNEAMVIGFLANNQQSVLICPDQVNELLKRNSDYARVSSRIKSLKTERLFDSSLTVKKMRVRALRLNHGSYVETDSATGKTYDIHRDVENLGYFIESDGFTVFHTGDGSPSNKHQFTQYPLATNEIDMVLVDRTFLRREGLELFGKDIRAKNIVFMHVEPGKGDYYRSVIQSIPEMFVFVKALETRTMVK